VILRLDVVQCREVSVGDRLSGRGHSRLVEVAPQRLLSVDHNPDVAVLAVLPLADLSSPRVLVARAEIGALAHGTVQSFLVTDSMELTNGT
jgi:hypothetical protein